MKRILIAAFATFLGLGLTVADVDAKRLGGSRSLGMQRNVTPPTPTAPAQNAASAKPTPQPAGTSRWLGPMVGLAAGMGLAALLSNVGLGEGFASFLMILLLIAAVVFVFRLLFRWAQPQSEYAGAGVAPAPMPLEARAAAGSSVPSTGHILAGFDTAGFLRQAKLHFVRLQAANDTKNLEDIRELTTLEMFTEIKLEWQERGNAPQQTDVVTLDAELLDVSEEGSCYLASVRFHGSIREEAGVAPAPCDEIWHLSKPVDGSHGWVLAGIQQFS